MKDWYLSRSPSEKRTLLVSALTLVLMLLYLVIWEPVMNNYRNQATNVAKQQELLVWVHDTAARIRQLSAHKSLQATDTGTPLLTLVEQTIKQQNLRNHLNRLEPQGAGKVQIWFKQVPFDSLIVWLQQMESKFGIAINTVSVQKQARPGTVDTRVVLGED